MTALRRGFTQSRQERNKQQVRGRSIASLRLCVRFQGFAVDSYMFDALHTLTRLAVWLHDRRRAAAWGAVGCMIFLWLLTPVTSQASGLPLTENESTGSQGTSASTPDLIEQSYQSGAISAEERLLYLAYAIYEPQSLPAEYHSTTPWFGTDIVAELNAAFSAGAVGAASSHSAFAQSELNRLLRNDAATVCDQPDAANSRDSANFHFNFGAIGGGLSAQEYVTSLENAFGVEVTSYGWAKPPYCSAASNCGGANPWGRYPVQVASLGSGLYGYVTVAGGKYTGEIGDNPNTPAIESAALASCMVLNNNYASFPGGAQFALDATTAHEFVHSIQFGYGDPGNLEDTMWYESSAAYMEDEVHDGSNDNYQYLWPSFDVCLGQYSGDNDKPSVYSNWLFFRFVAEQLGGTNLAGGGEEVMQQFFANVAAGQKGLRAYENALINKGGALRDVFHEYAIANASIAACPLAGAKCYEEAAGYQNVAGSIQPHGQINLVGGEFQGALANHFTASWISLPTSGAYSLDLANLSARGELRATIVAATANGLVVKPFPDIVAAGQQSDIPAYQTPTGATNIMAVITNQEWIEDDPTTCATSSFRLRSGAARPVAIDVRAPDDEALALNERIDYPFRLTNGGLSSSEFTLQVVSSLGWANAMSVPVTVTIDAGVTKIVTVPVTAPNSAGFGQVEETQLRAVSTLDAAVSDSAVVKTSLAGGKLYLPLIAFFEPPPPPPNRFDAAGDTAIFEGYPDDNACNDGELYAGFDDSADPDGKILRSLINFDLSEIPSGTAISGAALHLFHSDSWDFKDKTRTVTTHRITSGWNPCSVTWASQPSIGDAHGSQTIPWESGEWYSFDVSELVRGWINGSITNFGVAIRGPEAAGNDSSWRAFASGNTTNAPYLTIDYANTTGRIASGSAISAPEASGSTLAGREGASGAFAPMHVSTAISTARCTADNGQTQKCRASWQKEIAQ